MKKFLLPGIVIAVIALGVGGFFLFRSKPATSRLPQAAGKKQIINALPIDQRPFVALIPHASNRLLTLYFDKPGQGQNISLDIEYLAGSSLKGGRTSVTDLGHLPFTTAFLLGSCSTGGKCSFDTNITTGIIKTKMDVGQDLHVLRSNFVFVEGVDKAVTTDSKLAFMPTNKLTAPLILSQTHGFLGKPEGEIAAEPIALTATAPQKITGTLTIYAPDATKLVYYDGSIYQPLPASKTGDHLTADLSLAPWSKTVDIRRDDEEGASETVSLYLLGPIVPLK